MGLLRLSGFSVGKDTYYLSFGVVLLIYLHSNLARGIHRGGNISPNFTVKSTPSSSVVPFIVLPMSSTSPSPSFSSIDGEAPSSPPIGNPKIILRAPHASLMPVLSVLPSFQTLKSVRPSRTSDKFRMSGKWIFVVFCAVPRGSGLFVAHMGAVEAMKKNDSTCYLFIPIILFHLFSQSC